MLFELIQSFNRESLFIFNRIAVRCQYHTYCCIIFKLKIDLIQRSIDTGLSYLNEIIFHTW